MYVISSQETSPLLLRKVKDLSAGPDSYQAVLGQPFPPLFASVCFQQGEWRMLVKYTHF